MPFAAPVTTAVRSARSMRLATGHRLYFGATLKTGYLSPHQRANELFYNATHRMPELLYSDWVTPPQEARFIMDYVTRLTN